MGRLFARMLKGVLAHNLLQMLRQFSLVGEEVERSTEWLITCMMKVGAKIACQVGGGMFMRLARFLWAGTTRLCSGGERGRGNG